MAKAKTDAQKAAADRAKGAEFVGGPRDGDTLRLVNPPPAKIRLAFPVWCTYQWDKKIKKYRYIGDVKIEDNGRIV